MNESQNEVQTGFDLYWANLCNIAPDVVEKIGVREIAYNAYMNGASDRQRDITKHLGL